MSYVSLDYCNRRNAAELARCAAIGPECAVPLRTPGWVPPSERLIVNEHARGRIQFSSTTTRDEWHRNLGYGAVVWCGGIFETPLTAPGSPNEQWTRLQATKRNFNVCRLFDEAHAANVAAGHDGNWHNSPYPSERILSERSERHDYEYRVRDENRPLVRATPPNHGHGAKCGCVVDGVPLDHPLATNPICPHCSGTGRIICDDERVGRVSPSHAAGGYAEWRRNYPETPETIHGFPVSGQSTSNVSELDEESQEAYERAMERD